MRIAAGRLKGRSLPKAGKARPIGARLKTSLFSVLAPLLPGAVVLDICAGVGALGLEALSRGAEQVVLLDKDPRAVGALKAWAREQRLGRECQILRRDALKSPLPAGPYDVVFVDPPFAFFEDERAERLMARAARVVGAEGAVVVKAPQGVEPPEETGGPLRLVRRGQAASVTWWILERAEPAPGQAPTEEA